MLFNVIRDASCDYHRTVLPSQYLKLPKTQEISKASIYFFNRIPNHNLHDLRRMGIKIVCDIDDYWHLGNDHYLYHHFKAKGMAERIINSLKLADVVLTTHAKLADKVKAYNKNVHVVPNAIAYEKGQFNIGKQPYTGKIGFVGGMSHYKDITLVEGLKLPNQISIHNYMDHYKGLNICLAPLLKNEFNEHKSNLKVLEAGCGHSMVLASDLHPFRNPLDEPFVDYVKPKDWKEKIQYIVDNPNYAQDRGAALAEHCREHYDLLKVNKLREDLFKHLIR